MSFCPKCGNSFNITKSIIKSGQKGGKMTGHMTIEQIVDYIINDRDITAENVVNIDLTELTKAKAYRKLSKENKTLVYNTVSDLLPTIKLGEVRKLTASTAYYECENCQYHEPIKPQTLLYSKIFDDSSFRSLVTDSSYFVNSKILPRTRTYNCPNVKCITHKDSKQKEAIMRRVNDKSYQMVYVCTACKTEWEN